MVFEFRHTVAMYSASEVLPPARKLTVNLLCWSTCSPKIYTCPVPAAWLSKILVNRGAIEKLPDEILLRILTHIYHVATYEPFNMDSDCPKQQLTH